MTALGSLVVISRRPATHGLEPDADDGAAGRRALLQTGGAEKLDEQIAKAKNATMRTETLSEHTDEAGESMEGPPTTVFQSSSRPKISYEIPHVF